MGLIYFEGEFVTGMTIPSRLSADVGRGRNFGNKPKTKKHFEGLNQFFFRFFRLCRFSDETFLGIMAEMMHGIEWKGKRG